MITAIVIDPFKMENVNMLKLRTISAMKDELAKYCYQYLSEHRQQVSENNGFIDGIKIYLWTPLKCIDWYHKESSQVTLNCIWKKWRHILQQISTFQWMQFLQLTLTLPCCFVFLNRTHLQVTQFNEKCRYCEATKAYYKSETERLSNNQNIFHEEIHVPRYSLAV